MQNDVLATGLMSFTMHEVVYFGRSLPWIILDRLPYFNKYKIQNVCVNSLEPSYPADNRKAEDSDHQGTMELRSSGPHLPFHSRASSNMALPPNGAILRSCDWCTFSFDPHHGLPDCNLLCGGRHMALLDAQTSAHSSLIQDDPQAPSSIQCTFRTGC